MRAQDIIAMFDVESVIGDINRHIESYSALRDIKDGCITFCRRGNERDIVDGEYVIIVDKESKVPIYENVTYLIVKDPFPTFIKVLKTFFYKGLNQENIHPSAVIYDNVEIGKGVIIQAGAIIGSEGFGFFKNADGVYENFPHMGKVIIEDDVWIGANSAIACGNMGDTVIGQGSKFDNLVHIAHDVRVGKNVLMTPGTVVCGSVTIGDNCYIGAGSIIRDNITIGEGAFIGMGSIVVKDVRPRVTVFGNPAKER